MVEERCIAVCQTCLSLHFHCKDKYICNESNPSSFVFELAELHFHIQPLIHTSEWCHH